jgi:hypothetical protein
MVAFEKQLVGVHGGALDAYAVVNQVGRYGEQ